MGGGLAGGLVGMLVYGISVEALPLRGCQESLAQQLVRLSAGAASGAVTAILIVRSSTWWPRITAIALALVLAVPSGGLVYFATTMALADAGLRACPPR